jgi:hypothetical protein
MEVPFFSLADWALLCQVLMCLPQLQELRVSMGEFHLCCSLGLISMTGVITDVELMAILECLTAMRELKTLSLHGEGICALFMAQMHEDKQKLLSQTLKQSVERMMKTHCPQLERIRW